MLEALENRELLALSATLLRDIEDTSSSSPAHLFAMSDVVYFTATDETHGTELWKTDGSAEGTVLVKDINPGAAGSFASSFTNVAGTLFFVARDDAGTELWKSEGTEEGTVRVKDIRPGSDGSYPQSLVNFNGTLLFFSNDGTHGYELWQSDGSEDGTSLVVDSWSSGSGTLGSEIVVSGNAAYFSAAASGPELWKTDGTSEGTSIVRDFTPDGSLGSRLSLLVDVAGTLFFQATRPGEGSELWKSDGTQSGTVLVKDIRPGADDSAISSPVAVGNKLLFAANDGVHGNELWVSDGTATGTKLLVDFNAGPLGSTIDDFVSIGSRAFFTVRLGSLPETLYVSDGTETGTFALMPTVISSASSLANVNGQLYFRANSTLGDGVWTSGGTESTTMLVGEGGPSSSQFVPLGAYVLFTTTTVEYGQELWRTVDAPAGIALVRDIPSAQTLSSYPNSFVSVGDDLYFEASDLQDGPGLWKSDGTREGTTRITRHMPVSNLTNVNGILYFTGPSDGNYAAVWKSDGTAEGTTAVVEVPGLKSFNTTFVALGDLLIFTVYGDGHWWRSDGTPEGTFRLPQFVLDVPKFVVVGKTLYFLNVAGQLFKTDGTAEGTEPVLDSLGRSIYGVTYLVAVGETLYLGYAGGLWRLDDQSGQIVHFYQLPQLSSASGLAVIGNQTYFVASYLTKPTEIVLWHSDGTPEGTGLVVTLPSEISRVPSTIFTVGNVGYFTNYGPKGFGLWRTNGTSEGTYKIDDLSSVPLGVRSFFDVNGSLFFITGDNQLWYSDGTNAGTFQVSGPSVSYLSSPFTSQVVVGNRLYFQGVDQLGIEPWYVEAPSRIVDRWLLYNNSVFDGNTSQITPSDAAAIAPNKAPLVAGGGAASPLNLSSYSKGINGIVVDIAGARESLTAADFEFRMGNNNAFDQWVDAPSPNEIVVWPQAGTDGAERVVISWPDGAIMNTWLQVTLLANERTGLLLGDVFFWGSRVGDSGTGTGAFVTTTTDAAQVFATLGDNKPITDPRDYNRDGRVDAGDAMIVFEHLGGLTRIDTLSVNASVSTLAAAAMEVEHSQRWEPTDRNLAFALACQRSLRLQQRRDDLGFRDVLDEPLLDTLVYARRNAVGR